MGIAEFLTDDWKKIPQNLRYLTLAGSFLIFNTWLLDHWGREKPYTFWGWDMRSFGYSLGLSFILLGFLLLISKQFFYFGRVAFYRRKYPLDKLNREFYLAWFRGKLMLFDKKQKTYHHVLPWDTAQDLFFVGKGFQIEESFDPRAEYALDKDTFLNAKTYKSGQSINTQT